MRIIKPSNHNKNYLDIGHRTDKAICYISSRGNVDIKHAGNWKADGKSHADLFSRGMLDEAIISGRYDPDTKELSVSLWKGDARPKAIAESFWDVVEEFTDVKDIYIFKHGSVNMTEIFSST